MKAERETRAATNEGIFREINEGIARGQWPGEDDAPVGFRCECARLGCNQLVELTIAEYERVRAHPRRFLVVAGHDEQLVETVAESRSGYVVVEKRGQAGVVAQETDPRP